MGLSPTSTKMGLVCEEGRMRSATQLLRRAWHVEVTSRNLTIGHNLLFRNGLPVNDHLHRHLGGSLRSGPARCANTAVRSSDGLQIRVRLRVQPGRDPRRDVNGAGLREAQFAAVLAHRQRRSTLKSIRWLRPSLDIVAPFADALAPVVVSPACRPVSRRSGPGRPARRRCREIRLAADARADSRR